MTKQLPLCCRIPTFLPTSIAGQEVHKNFGGVVPELASRAHQQNIVSVVDEALKKAGVKGEDISAVAFTQGPGFIGFFIGGRFVCKGFCVSIKHSADTG